MSELDKIFTDIQKGIILGIKEGYSIDDLPEILNRSKNNINKNWRMIRRTLGIYKFRGKSAEKAVRRMEIDLGN